jgi:hypothetical protein
MAANELKNLSPTGEEISGNKEARDDANLARLGKKSVLKVSRDSNGTGQGGS